MSDPDPQFGMFADLVAPPKIPNKPEHEHGMFSDLVNHADTNARAATLTFDDLIPGGAAKPPAAVDLPKKPSIFGEYWDATKKAAADIGAEFKKGYGDKSAVQLWATESFPADIYKGTKRVLTGKQPTKDKEPTDPGIVKDLEALGISAKEHPGILAGSLVRSLVADPELLLPWLWESIPGATALRVAQAARAMGASVSAAKVTETIARVAARAGVGAAAGAATEGGHQFATGNYDAGKVGKSAVEGAALAAALPIKGKAKEFKPPEGFEVVGTTPEGKPRLRPILRDPVEHVAATVDSTAEAIHAATKEDPINPELVKQISEAKPVAPGESTERLVKVIKQAAIGGAVGAGIGATFAGKDTRKIGAEAGAAAGILFPLLKLMPYRGVDIAPLVNARNGAIQSVTRHIYQFQRQVETLVPDKAMRERIAENIDTGTEPPAGSPDHEAFVALKKFFADMGQVAKEAGVVDDLRDNYISHIVEEDPAKTQSWISRAFGREQPAGGAGAKTFGMARKYDTFEELQAAIKESGLRIKTKDASEIAGIYGNAVYRSVANRKLLDALKEARLPDGSPLIMPNTPEKGGRAPPSDWVQMANPSLHSVKVHPDIAPDLQFVYSHSDPNAVLRGMRALTSSTKRVTVSMSLFHAKSLLEGWMLASRLKKTPTLGLSINAAMKVFREGGNNDTIDRLIKGGLMIGTPEDVAGHEVQHFLDKMGDALNAKFPLKGLGVGAVSKGLAKIDKGVERFTFGYLQTGMKLQTAMNEFENLVRKGVPVDKAAKSAAAFTNDVFGSLDYYRVATDTESHIMRAIGTSTLNSNSRKVLQLLMFAPDWTIATFRSMMRGMPGATDQVTQQLYRRYQLKAAIYYLTVGNVVNQVLSGHSIFENQNPTRIELPNGQTMQFAKHETEPLDWLRHPVETAIGKAAFIPRAGIEIARSHIIAKAYKKPEPTPVEDVEQILKDMAPISLQQYIQNGGSPEAVAGQAGFPIYGKPTHKGGSLHNPLEERGEQ